jgi:hypothetical protein
MAGEVQLGDIPDSDILPNPEGEMYEFYEGLDSNLFSESTGMNHNAAAKWLKAQVLRNLEYLSYLLDVKDGQTIVSQDIVHTLSLIDKSVTLPKLSEELQNLLINLRTANVIERNSVQTSNCISLVSGKIRVATGTVISQANGFDEQGQFDLTERLATVDLVATVGNTPVAYLYKQIGGGYTQSTTKQNILNLTTMIGTKVLLGTFSVVDGVITSVTPAVPTFKVKAIEEPTISGQYIKLPSGTTAERPTLVAEDKAIRYNTTLATWESWNGSFWGDLGTGQLLGSTKDKAVMFMSQSIVGNLTIPDGCNGFSIGRVAIEAGSKLTVPAGSVYKII